MDVASPVLVDASAMSVDAPLVLLPAEGSALPQLAVGGWFAVLQCSLYRRSHFLQRGG